MWGGTGYNVGAGVVRYSLSGLGKLLKRFLGGYAYYFSIMVCLCLTYYLQKCKLCFPWSAVWVQRLWWKILKGMVLCKRAQSSEASGKWTKGILKVKDFFCHRKVNNIR